MRILIVDDEAPARLRLRALVEEQALGEVVAEAATGREALEAARRAAPHVVLLDIRMPGMDGLEAAGHLASLHTPPAVIFTTAYDDYALQAFEAQAVGYLLKPVRRERLAQALQGAQRLNRVQLDSLRAQRPRARTHISARVHGDIRLVPIEAVHYFQADQKYVTVVGDEGEVLIEESLKALEEEFGERFVRIHRNALVARDRLLALERDRDGRAQLRLRGSACALEVSRRHLAALRRLMRRA